MANPDVHVMSWSDSLQPKSITQYKYMYFKNIHDFIGNVIYIVDMDTHVQPFFIVL